jgi:hypothetical protein
MTWTQEDMKQANALIFGLSRRTCSMSHALSHARMVVHLMERMGHESPRTKWVGTGDALLDGVKSYESGSYVL